MFSLNFLLNIIKKSILEMLVQYEFRNCTYLAGYTSQGYSIQSSNLLYNYYNVIIRKYIYSILGGTFIILYAEVHQVLCPTISIYVGMYLMYYNCLFKIHDFGSYIILKCASFFQKIMFHLATQVSRIFTKLSQRGVEEVLS